MQLRSDAAPARIAVEAGWEVGCPWHGRIVIDRCRACPFLQGTLDGPDLLILCGFAHGAPLRRPRRMRGWIGARRADG
jgi:hypothetical protein